MVLFYWSYSLVIKLIIKSDTKISDILILVVRSISSQSIPELNNLLGVRADNNSYKGKLQRLSVLILITIWLLISLILTKCFTSILLKTYFDPKCYLIVNSVDEILKTSELSIAGSESLIFINASKPKELSILMPRVLKYENELKATNKGWRKLIGSELVMSRVVSGQTVLFLDSYAAAYTRRLYPNSKLMSALDKYSPNYKALFISKQHFLYKRIAFM